MSDDQIENRPPYLSLTTLLRFFERFGDGPIPPRIDRSALETYSGATQAMLMSTLRQIGFVDDEGRVGEMMRRAAASPSDLMLYLESWARVFYAKQLALADNNGTSQMLQESFAEYGYTGSTVRKAIVFYLALVEYLGLPNSPYFKPPKQSATPTSRRRGSGAVRRAERQNPADRVRAATTAVAPPVARGDVTTIHIGALATITVNVDAQWMKLPVETITAMREAIARLEALANEAEE